MLMTMASAHLCEHTLLLNTKCSFLIVTMAREHSMTMAREHGCADYVLSMGGKRRSTMYTGHSLCARPIVLHEHFQAIVQSSLVQPITTYYSLIQPITAQSSLLQPSTAQYSLVQPITAQSSLVQPITAQSSLVQPITAQSSLVAPITAQSSLVQPSTT